MKSKFIPKSKKIQVNPRLESLEILGYSRIYHLARIHFPARGNGNNGHIGEVATADGQIKNGIKVYIPLRRKLPGVGGWRWAMPPTPEFSVGDTNMLVYFSVT